MKDPTTVQLSDGGFITVDKSPEALERFGFKHGERIAATCMSEGFIIGVENYKTVGRLLWIAKTIDGKGAKYVTGQQVENGVLVRLD